MLPKELRRLANFMDPPSSSCSLTPADPNGYLWAMSRAETGFSNPSTLRHDPINLRLLSWTMAGWSGIDCKFASYSP